MVTVSLKMKISHLAKDAAVGVETVRYYQRIGIMRTPDRKGGIRHYELADLQRLRFIRRAQSLGFTLEEIAALLKLSAADCKNAEQIARERLTTVRERIASLRRVQRVLEGVVRRCVNRQPHQSCPIIETLALP